MATDRTHAGHSLKPPTAAAIEQALNILLNSIRAENGHITGCVKRKSKHTPVDLIPTDERCIFASGPADVTLKGLQDQSDALQTARLALAKESKIRMADIARRRNCLVPVNQLPFEITTQILLSSIPSSEHRDLERLRAVSHVQFSWWNIVKTCPSFWTTIYATSNAIVELKLRKSGALPVDIFYEEEPRMETRRSPLAILKAHRERYRSLHLGWYTIDLLRAVTGIRMPNLKKLALIPRNDFVEDDEVEFLKGSSLRHLEIEGSQVRWDKSTELGHLKILKLNYWEFEMTPQAFTDALASCVELEELELISIGSVTQSPPSQQPILLPLLRRVSLRDPSEDLAEVLITTIHAEHLEELNVTFVNDEQWELEQLARNLLASKQPPSLLSTLLRRKELKSIKINLDYYRMIVTGDMEGEQGELVLVFGHNGRCWLDIFADFPRLSLANGGIPLHLLLSDSYGGDASGGPVHPSLMSLKNLVSLELECGPQVGLGIAYALVQVPYPGPAQWPCPRLERINVNMHMEEYLLGLGDSKELWDEFIDVFEDMVEGRNGDEAAAAGVAKLAVYRTRRNDGGVDSFTLVQDIISLFPRYK